MTVGDPDCIFSDATTLQVRVEPRSAPTAARGLHPRGHRRLLTRRLAVLGSPPWPTTSSGSPSPASCRSAPGWPSRPRSRPATLGYRSFWTAETTGPEAFSLLAAAGAAAPGLDLGTGVLALQLRTPMVAAMGAATLQALHPDADILSASASPRRWSPALARRRLRRAAAGPGAGVRDAGEGVPVRREGRLRRRLLPGEGVPARAAARRAEAQGRGRRAEPGDADAGRRGGRRRPAQLPAGLARGLVGRADPRRRRRRDLRATSTPASATATRRSTRPAGTSSPTPWSTPTPPTSAGPASATRSTRSASATPPATARAPSPRCRTGCATPSTWSATPTSSATRCAPTSTPASTCRSSCRCPWGGDRRQVITDTMEAGRLGLMAPVRRRRRTDR